MFPGCLEPSLQSDLVLVSRDGVRSPCHAALLAVFSPLLANILGEVEDQEIILDWESSLVTSLLQYLYTGEVRLEQEEHKEDLQEMMGHLGIVSPETFPDLKLELELEETDNLPSELPALRPCYVGLENIKLPVENILTAGVKEGDISNKNNVCPDCGKSFTRKSNMREHVANFHSEQTPGEFHCIICLKTFRKRSNLRVHLAKVHDKIPAKIRRDIYKNIQPIQIQPEKIEVEREEKEVISTSDREGEDQVMQEQSFLLKPPSNSPKQSVKKQSDNVASPNDDNAKKHPCLDVYPALSLVELLHCCALIGRELHALKGPIIGALSDATPAVLCHKEPARASKAPY